MLNSSCPYMQAILKFHTTMCSHDGTDDGTMMFKYVLSGPSCVVQLACCLIAGRQATMGRQRKVSHAVCKLVTNCIVLYCIVVFFCLVYFPVDLEVFYLDHVKKSLQYNTIQYYT